MRVNTQSEPKTAAPLDKLAAAEAFVGIRSRGEVQPSTESKPEPHPAAKFSPLETATNTLEQIKDVGESWHNYKSDAEPADATKTFPLPKFLRPVTKLFDSATGILDVAEQVHLEDGAGKGTNKAIVVGVLKSGASSAMMTAAFIAVGSFSAPAVLTIGGTMLLSAGVGHLIGNFTSGVIEQKYEQFGVK